MPVETPTEKDSFEGMTPEQIEDEKKNFLEKMPTLDETRRKMAGEGDEQEPTKE